MIITVQSVAEASEKKFWWWLNSKATTEVAISSEAKPPVERNAVRRGKSRSLHYAMSSLREATTPVEMTGHFEIEPLPKLSRGKKLKCHSE